MNTTDCNSGKTHHQRPGALFLFAIVFAAILTVITSCKTKTGNNTDLIAEMEAEELRLKENNISRKWINTDNGLDGFIDYDSLACSRYKESFEHITYLRLVPDLDEIVRFRNAEHYYAVEDLLALYADSTIFQGYYRDSSFNKKANCEGSDLELTEKDKIAIWRLYMFYPLTVEEKKVLAENRPSCNADNTDLAYHRFRMLHLRIDSLLKYEPYYIIDYELKRNLAVALYRMYSRAIFEALEYSREYCREDPLMYALNDEAEAFVNYMASADAVGTELLLRTSDCLYFPGSHNYEWKYLDYILDNWKIRTLSLQYYMFSIYCYSEVNIIDGEYPYMKCNSISENSVLKEYDRFVRTLREEDLWVEDSLDVVSSLQERRNALLNEKEAWIMWMKARHKLSSVLKNWNRYDKESFDRSTRNILYRKWIQLNNQFKQLGESSDDIKMCLLKDNCTVKDLRKSCFAERWDKYISAGN